MPVVIHFAHALRLCFTRLSTPAIRM